MSLAVGLGGFWNGFEKGNGLGIRLQNNYRAKKNQAEIDGLNQQAKTDFNQKVQTGEYNGDQFYDYMMKSVVPKIRDTYMQQGNYDTANNFNTWMESDTGKRKTKLFGQGYAALNNGDHSTFINVVKDNAALDGIKELDGSYIEGKDGSPSFYRFSYLDGNGKRQYQTILKNDALDYLVKQGNPQAAYEAETQTANEQRKRQNDLAFYREKKAIDAQYTQNQREITYSDALKIAQDSPDWMNQTTEEHTKTIKKIMEDASSKTAPGLAGTTEYGSAQPPQQNQNSTAKVIVDTSTGKIVGDYGESTKENPPQNKEDPQAENVPQTDNVLKDKKAIISRAYEIFKKGESNGKKVSLQLLASQLDSHGIRRDELPDDMRRALPELGYFNKGAALNRGLNYMLDAQNDEILQQWQKRKPVSDREIKANDAEKEALALMKNGTEPYKIEPLLRNIRYDELSPEFKIMYNRYQDDYDYDKALKNGKQQAPGIGANQQYPVTGKNPVGLGRIPVPTPRPML